MGLLFSVLIMVIIFGLLYWIVGLLPFPEPFKQIALVIIGVIFLLYLLGLLFGYASPFPVFVHGGYR